MKNNGNEKKVNKLFIYLFIFIITGGLSYARL